MTQQRFWWSLSPGRMWYQWNKFKLAYRPEYFGSTRASWHFLELGIHQDTVNATPNDVPPMGPGFSGLVVGLASYGGASGRRRGPVGLPHGNTTNVLGIDLLARVDLILDCVQNIPAVVGLDTKLTEQACGHVLRNDIGRAS